MQRVAQQALNQAANPGASSNAGFLNSVAKFISDNTPSSTTALSVTTLVVTGGIWAAGQGCLIAGQQNPIAYAVGTSLNSFALFVLTGGGIALGGKSDHQYDAIGIKGS